MKVPKMAPAVLTADSLPTTDPVSCRLVNRILTTTGVTALRTTAGAKNPRAVRVTIWSGSPPRMPVPAAVTIVGARMVSRPPPMRSGPSSRFGG